MNILSIVGLACLTACIIPLTLIMLFAGALGVLNDLLGYPRSGG